MTQTAILLPWHGVMPQIAADAFIAPNATVIGDVIIGAEASIWFGTIVRGDVHEIRIGARTNIQDATVVHCTAGKFGTYIGADITIGHGAILHACTLEDGCFIGMGATVMDGAVVESGAMIAAGALVTPGKRVKRGQLWAGSPAKCIRPVSDDERAFFPVSMARRKIHRRSSGHEHGRQSTLARSPPSAPATSYAAPGLAPNSSSDSPLLRPRGPPRPESAPVIPPAVACPPEDFSIRLHQPHQRRLRRAIFPYP
ncbi:MAG: gamma carbonic anhydrase family protein [Alphaproteobacteria bacterium]|nr:gamma carbonic anhydrase family protein [Alphaproteobacteria bacterium]